MRHGNQLGGTRPEQHFHFFNAKFSNPGRANIESRMLYRTYQCPFCQKSFRDEYMHRFHMLKEHDAHETRNVRFENLI